MISKVEVDVEEIKRVYLLIEKFNEFLHQPANFSKVDSFAKDIYPELREVYYRVMWEWLPNDLKDEIEDR